VQENFKKHMDGKNIPPYEYACVTKSGRRIDTLITTRLIDYQGERAILGIVTDISTRKRAEEQLKSSEEKYRDLYDSAPDMYHSLNKEGIIIDCNETEARMLGYKKAEIIGRPLTDFFTEKSRDLFHKDYSLLHRRRKHFTVEREFVRRNGTKFPASLHISAELDENGKITKTRTIARDVTDLKKVEEELRNRERDYRIILQNVDEIIYAVNIREDIMEGRILFVSNKIKDILDYRPSEFMDNPKLWLSIMHPDDRVRVEKDTRRILEDRKKLIRTYRLRNKNSDQYRWFEDRLVPKIDERGTIVSFFGVARDITQNKIAEEALIEKERKYRSLFEDSYVPIFTTTRGGTFLDVNRAMLDLFGYTREKMIGMDLLEIYADPDDRKKFQAAIEQDGLVRDYEMQLIRKDGRVVHCLMTASLRQAADGSIFGYQGVLRDITQEKKIEQERLTMQKLDSIGLLAGGIAHDFNNILTAIIGNISLAMMYASPKSELGVRLTDAEKAALRARDLTQQLLTFSKGGEPIKKALYLNDLIRESGSFSLRGSNVAYDISIPEDLWPADADESQLSQALNNIIINAKQAMPDGGLIRIIAENIMIEEEEVVGLDNGRYLKISIKDQGSGISTRDMKQIFEPYFTTKEEGSGLGLSIAFSIISKHGGTIIAESAEGYGTNMHLYLPVSESRVQKREIAGEGVIPGKGKILVMDDEEMVRVVAAEILRQLGYDSEFAEDGQEAVELYEEALKTGSPYDVVILDLTIPGGMGGEEAMNRIKERDPAVKAIVSSGYSNDPVMANHKAYGFTDIIAKPYKIPELSRVLNKVLSGKS
jgi:PAS domain S-box-containing protein